MARFLFYRNLDNTISHVEGAAMLKHQFISLISLGCAFAALGCAADESTTEVSGDDVNDVGLSPAAFEFNNGLSPSCFWNHSVQGYLRDLGKNKLVVDATGTLPATSLLFPNACNDAVKYAVQCGLGSDKSVTFKNMTYTGAVGLAPDWDTRGLNTDERRWVTACMVQRLNVAGLTVPILLEGDHSPLYENTAQDATYWYQESTAFGDLFSSTAPLTGLTPAFTAYFCGETNNAASGSCIDVSSLLNLRVCDNAGILCGMQYIGKCSDVCTANGPYWNCQNVSQTIRVQTQDNLCSL
jgi:hypothetical protein